MGDAAAGMVERGGVEAELPCFECLYDLRGAPEDGVCPECGAPVALSRRADRWDRVSAGHRRCVRIGTALMAGDYVVLIGGLVVRSLFEDVEDWATAAVLPRLPGRPLRGMSKWAVMLLLAGWGTTLASLGHFGQSEEVARVALTVLFFAGGTFTMVYACMACWALGVRRGGHS
jgi:hypothetical protein